MLSNDELLKINGGEINYLLISGVTVGLISLFIGMVDGYLNPISCNLCKKAHS